MKNNQLIKSSGGIVIRKDRNIWKVALLYKNQAWFFPKGRIEKGENEEQAALREIKEELGIPIKKLKIITKLGYMKYIASQADDHFLPRPKKVSIFLIKTNQSKIMPIRKEGFEKAEWFSLEGSLGMTNFPDITALLFKALCFLSKKERKEPQIKTVAVAVGGKGERMQLSKKKKIASKLLIPFQGKAFLKYLLDILLIPKFGFDKIYLLTSHYRKEIDYFIRNNYHKSEIIKTVDTKAHTVPQAIYSMRNVVKQPFFYIDGNIICNPYLFKEIISQHLQTQPLITIAVSPKNLASTHLQLKIEKGRIKDAFSGLSLKEEKNKKNFYCSIGMFILDHRIFNLLPDLVYFYDFDLVLTFLVKSKMNYKILPYIYKGKWYCIHTQNDLELINREGTKFFRSLKKQKGGIVK